MKKTNSTLSKKQISVLKTMLLDEKKRITSSIKTNSINYSIQNSETKDCVDEANENILVSHNVRLTNRENLYLKKIIKSLRKIEKGDYGVCDECESPILFTRLKARPTSDLCIVCKEDAEKEEQHNYFGRRSKSLGRSIQLA